MTPSSSQTGTATNQSNVSQSWGDSGWSQDGATVFKKEENETETTNTKSDNQAEGTTEVATEAKP